MASINFEVNSNSIDNKCQVILRTNPLLTSNVKLVTDSSGELYLDSISANKTLSDQRYKKFAIDSTGHLAYDIAKFYDKTPLKAAYGVLRKDSDTSVYREYQKQYEEQYHYGATLNSYKEFSENIRFMAPLWIDEKLPEYFVVYRIEEPVSTMPLTNDLYGINDRIMTMLSNATIVKAFDMRPGSKLGNYLHRFANDPDRPLAPLTASFEKDGKTSWNGIDLIKGGFTQKSEFIYNAFVNNDRPEILNNAFITEGFGRNNLVSANLINLEFLFEDFDNPYEVNRYIGIYVNAHEEGSFKHTKYDGTYLTINPSTVDTNFDLTGTSLVATDMLPTLDLVDPVLQWVKSGDSFAHIKNNAEGKVLDPYKLKVNAFDITADKYVKKLDTLQIYNLLDDSRDYLTITVNGNPNIGDTYILGVLTEVIISGDTTPFKIVAEPVLPAGTYEDHKFSNKGTVEQVTFAMMGAIKNIEDLSVSVSAVGNVITINNYRSGNRMYNFFFAQDALNGSAVSVEGLSDNVLKHMKLDAVTGDVNFYTDWNVWSGRGGSAVGSGFLVTQNEIGDIDENTWVRNGNKFIRIVEIIKDDTYTDLYRVCLDGPIDKLEINDNSVNLWVENKIKFGKFEAFDFYDFDFNFYSTANSDLGELVYEDYIVDIQQDQLEDIVKYSESAQTYFNNLISVNTGITKTGSGVTKIANEYDRLQENNNTDFALYSRVVPTVNKWKYFEGVNCRENPYMLSMSEAFGKTNFAPDITVDGRNINGMTHEWFYLYQHPTYNIPDGTQYGQQMTSSDVAEMVTKLKSYIQPELNIELTEANLKDIDNNWFDRLFVYDGFDYTGVGFAPATPTPKYVRLRKGSDAAPAEALFRGLKVKIYGRKEFLLANPQNLITSTEFNDYKFTAVLDYKYDNDFDNVQIKAIQNKVFKTITLYINVNSSERNLSFLNRKLLYNLQDFVDYSGTPVDTNINGYLDFDIPQAGQDNYIDAVGVDTKLLREIQLNEDGGYNNIKFDYAGTTWLLPVSEVYNNNSIRINTTSFGIVYDELGVNTLNISLLPSTVWSTTSFKYVDGGYKLAKSTFESISAKAIADLLNNNDTRTIKYITIDENGNELLNRFIINIEDGHEIVRTSDLITSPDPNKPNSYKVSSGKVGDIIVERNDPHQVKLIRMSGDYTPLARPVVTFTDIHRPYKTTQIIAPDAREKLLYNRYNRLGVAFGSYMNQGQYKYGLIEDMFYHKINPEKADGILKLSNSTSELPLYPLIGEIAIDRRDINVFRSSWEPEFYAKNDSNKQVNYVYGTLSPYEEGAFLASTLNLPKNQYDITAYPQISWANSLDDMKTRKAANNFKGSAVVFEDDDKFYMDLYIGNVLTDLLISDNAGISIKKYVNTSESYGDKTTLDDDIKKYIEVNLLQLMNITDVRLFVNESKDIKVSQILNANSLSDILYTPFLENKNFILEYDNINPLNIRVIYNKRPGFRQEIYIYTKINS